LRVGKIIAVFLANPVYKLQFFLHFKFNVEQESAPARQCYNSNISDGIVATHLRCGEMS